MSKKVVFELRNPSRSVYARALPEPSGAFLVLKNSICYNKRRKNDNFGHLRKDLISKDILTPSSSETFIFKKDVRFESATAAASVIMGGNASGPFSWKLEGSNTKYSDWKS